MTALGEGARTVRFSVVIPVFNAEDYLEECLDSVLGQTFGDYEIVIVDDGSTDGSGRIADEYSLTHTGRMQCIHQRNSGQLFARRAGYFSASGEYIVSLDADDMLVPSALEVLNAALIATGADMVLFDAYLGLSKKKKLLSYPFENGRMFETESDKTVLYELMAGTDTLNNLCTKAFSARLLDFEADYEFARRMRFGEDAVQAMALVSAARRIVATTAPLYVYRMNEKGITHSFNQAYFDDLALHTEVIKGYCEKWALPDGTMLAVVRYLKLFCSLLRKMFRAKKLDRTALSRRSEDRYFRKAYEAFGHCRIGIRNRITLLLVCKNNYELTVAILCLESLVWEAKARLSRILSKGRTWASVLRKSE